jgi:hypothetical protein
MSPPCEDDSRPAASCLELTPTTAHAVLRHAFDQMLLVAEGLGEPQIHQRPLGPTTNAVGALIVHCCEVTEFWLGHVALGRPSNRDREAEFSAVEALNDLRRRVATCVATASQDLERIGAGGGGGEHGAREFLPGTDRSDVAVVLYVLKELSQHLGHIELAADALRQPRPDLATQPTA